MFGGWCVITFGSGLGGLHPVDCVITNRGSTWILWVCFSWCGCIGCVTLSVFAYFARFDFGGFDIRFGLPGWFFGFLIAYFLDLEVLVPLCPFNRSLYPSIVFSIQLTILT